MMNFEKYKNRLRQYISAKLNIDNFDNNIKCFCHSPDINPSMHIYEDHAKCFSCGLNFDLYDCIQHFEHITDKSEQFKFAEKFFGDLGYTPIKEKFTINQEAFSKVIDYIRQQINTPEAQKYLNFFAKKRGYGDNFKAYFGYYPGYEKAKSDLSEDILKSAGITEKAFYYPGAILRFFDNQGIKKISFNKDSKCLKFNSLGSKTIFPAKLPDTEDIVISEGEIDCIVLMMNGLKAISFGGVNGIFNNIKILEKYKTITICFDNDEPGITGSIKAAERIHEIYPDKIIKIVDLPKIDNYKDVDDFNKAVKFDIVKKSIVDAKIFNKGGKKDDSGTLDKTGNIDSFVNNSYNIDNNGGLTDYQLMEQSFFVKNSLIAETMRKDDELFRRIVYLRPDLAPQEAARLYFCEMNQGGLKLQSDGITDTVWIYNRVRKYWVPLADRLDETAMELFIKKYGASWILEKKTATEKPKAFFFKKNNSMRNEIESHFKDIVQGNITPIDDPFGLKKKKKTISCNNCVLVWNDITKKFDQKPHSADNNLVVAPFPFNRIDMNQLSADQKSRLELVKKYFAQLVGWNKDEKLELINFILAYIGYTFSSWREKCFHVWIGTKDSGKSTLSEILGIIHGNKFGETKFSKWAKNPGAHDNAVLVGKLILVDDDFEVGGRLPEEELKSLSQNSTQTINPKHRAQFTITNTATPLILTNGMPRAEDMNIDNRLYAVPFNSNFSRENRTADNEIFINKIKEHETLEILFNLAIDIASETIFFDNNFDKIAPKCVKKTTEDILQSASSVLMWISDMEAQGKLIVDKKNMNIKIKRSDLYQLYVNNYTGIKKGLHAFYESVRQRYQDSRTTTGEYFLGIGEKYEEKRENLTYKD